MSRSPAAQAVAAPLAGPVSLTFSQPVVTATAPNVRVFGGLTGRRGGTVATTGAQLRFQPAQPLRPGEQVNVTVPATVQAGGQPVPPLVYQFTGATTPATGHFGAGPDVPVRGGALMVRCADLDGDGDADLITANAPDTAIHLAFNDGQGHFGPAQRVRVGIWPLSVAPADVDADGDVDLLVTANGAASVWVLTNDGTGTFTNGQVVTVGLGPTDLVAADLDADGDLDLAVGNSPTGRVSVRFNNGQGRFSGTVSMAVGFGAASVQAADVDNDGDLDLLAVGQAGTTNGNQTPTKVAVRLNDGTGHFTNGPDVLIGYNAIGVAVADLDGDGDVDIFTANSRVTPSRGSMNIRFNDGTGRFAGGPDLPLPDFTGSPVAADLDGDGDLDALLTQQSDSVAKVFVNDGQGRFTPGPDVPTSPGNYALTAADLDGDGALDLAVSTSELRRGGVNVRFNGRPTGLPDASEAAFSLWPNPAHGTVRLRGLPAGPIRLTDALGRVVRAYEPQAPDFDLPLGGLAPGLYVVRAGAVVRRLVVE